MFIVQTNEEAGELNASVDELRLVRAFDFLIALAADCRYGSQYLQSMFGVRL